MTIKWAFSDHSYVKLPLYNKYTHNAVHSYMHPKHRVMKGLRWIIKSLPAWVIMHDFLSSTDFLHKHFFPKKEESFQIMQSLSNSLDSKSGPTFCHF